MLCFPFVGQMFCSWKMSKILNVSPGHNMTSLASLRLQTTGLMICSTGLPGMYWTVEFIMFYMQWMKKSEFSESFLGIFIINGVNPKYTIVTVFTYLYIFPFFNLNNDLLLFVCLFSFIFTLNLTLFITFTITNNKSTFLRERWYIFMCTYIIRFDW